MTPAALIEQLERQGLKLSADGDELVCRGAKCSLNPGLLRELERRKPELLQALARPRTPSLRLVPGGAGRRPRAVPQAFIRALAEAIVADMDGPDA